jgi:hypothetical protein
MVEALYLVNTIISGVYILRKIMNLYSSAVSYRNYGNLCRQMGVGGRFRKTVGLLGDRRVPISSPS